jgi:cysteinyl-tRNA synthetase
MHFYELDNIVRKHSDTYRLVDKQQWYTLQQSNADMGMAISGLNAKDKALERIVSLLEWYMEELREEGNYAVSDRIRDALITSGAKDWY